MRTQKLFFTMFFAFLLVATGCSNGIKNQEQKIIVQERVGDKDVYNHFRDVSDTDQVSKAIKILNSTNWENAEVSMAYAPHYKFHFEYIDKEIKSDGVIYALWISPTKDKIELVMQGESKYVQLSKGKSAELFEIVTGKKLSDLK